MCYSFYFVYSYETSKNHYVQRYHVLDLPNYEYIYMKYEIKNYVVITVLLIGFAGVVTATASKLASATPATSPVKFSPLHIFINQMVYE